MAITRYTRDGECPMEMAAVAAWVQDRPPITPFSPQARATCAEVSRRLFADPLAARRPDLAALAYWLRPASIEAMAQSFLADLPTDCLAVPRGVALLFPPANVDTVVAYGWALSLLAGNASILRVSDRLGDSGRRVLALLLETAESHSLFLRTPHDDAVTAALSALTDLRVMWGGDASVAALRAIPVPPRSRDVLFPDRRSLAALSLAAYAAADGAERDRLADAFTVDTMTFGQLACSSPRLLAWIGTGDADAATADFFPRVGAAIDRRGMQVPLGQVLACRTQAAGATLDGRATGWRNLAGTLTLLNWADPAVTPEDWVGGGLFLLTRVNRLEDLARACDRRTQTLAAHGFTHHDIAALVTAAGSRAPDRIVPFGRALAFDRVWDGMDLLREFTRMVHVPGQ